MRDAGCAAYSAGSGALRELLYMPERSKQQARRLPEASMSQAVAMRLARVSAFLPEVIQAIQSRMESRFTGTLRAGFDSGALGFTSDGMISVRDAGKLELKDRVAMNAAVADDNRDRKAVYREVAVANGHPEWEGQIRDVFAKQWVDSAKSGWWYQSGGGWKQK